MAASGGSTFGHALRAIFHPIPITLAVGTGVAAFLSAIFAVPLAAAWLVSVGVLTRNRAREARQPDTTHLPPSIQADLAGVSSALDQLQEAARSVPATQRPMFEGIEREAEGVRESVVQLGLQAGALHRHLEAEVHGDGASDADAGRRERLLARLERQRETLHSLEESARELADRALDLAAGGSMGYDELDEKSPERKISEMKASVAAIEEVTRAETETI